MTARAASRSHPTDGAGDRLRNLAFVVLLAVVACRCFLGEMPFRTSSIRVAPARAGNVTDIGVDRREAAGAVYSCAIFAAVALWALAGAVDGQLRLNHPRLAIAVAAFAVLSLASASKASDRCAAADAWVQQTALLAGMVLAAELCGDRGRWRVLVTVLAAAAVCMVARGLWHIYETPYRIETFEQSKQQLLAEHGWAEGSVNAKDLEARARSYAPIGYVGLGNVFASGLLVFAGVAIALAVAKVRGALAARAEWRKTRKPGEIHLPTTGALLTVPAAAAVVAILVLTRSRGAIAAACVAVVAAGVLLRWGQWFCEHRRKALLAVGAVLAAGAIAVVAWGLTTGGLPTKTMTFRWFYWSAGAKALAERPMLGVGGGNFPAAYLRHRTGAGEEAVKTPHNVVVHALVQFGLPGGLCYLGILAAVLVGVTQRAQPPPETDVAKPKQLFAAAAATLCAIFLTRAIFAGMAGATELLLLDAVGACVVAAVAMAVHFRGGRTMTIGRPGRVIVGASLWAFTLHNMVTLGFWSSGPAMLFWTVAGGMLATAETGPAQARTLKRFRWPAAAGAVVMVVVVFGMRVMPAINKTRLTEAASAAASVGRWPAAHQLAQRAIGADPTDSATLENAAIVLLSEPTRDEARYEANRIEAFVLASRASKQNPLHAGHARRAAETAWAMLRKTGRRQWAVQAEQWFAAAVALDPANSHLHLQVARFFQQAGQRGKCLEHLERAEDLQGQLLAGSSYTFSTEQIKQINRMRRESGQKK